jgi:hypothetical protein
MQFSPRSVFLPFRSKYKINTYRKKNVCQKLISYSISQIIAHSAASVWLTIFISWTQRIPSFRLEKCGISYKNNKRCNSSQTKPRARSDLTDCTETVSRFCVKTTQKYCSTSSVSIRSSQTDDCRQIRNNKMLLSSSSIRNMGPNYFGFRKILNLCAPFQNSWRWNWEKSAKTENTSINIYEKYFLWTVGVGGFDSRRGLGIFLSSTASGAAVGPIRPPI